jgi:hypothetical protein
MRSSLPAVGRILKFRGDGTMGISQVFLRTREDDSQVEYAFGASPASLNRRLVIDKQTRESRPIDDLRNGNFRATAGKIFRLESRDGSWPERGWVQS